MSVYEAWENEDSSEVHFSAADGIAEQRAAVLMRGSWRLLHRIEADSWEEAMARHHDLMGWAPYRPMVES